MHPFDLPLEHNNSRKYIFSHSDVLCLESYSRHSIRLTSVSKIATGIRMLVLNRTMFMSCHVKLDQLHLIAYGYLVPDPHFTECPYPSGSDFIANNRLKANITRRYTSILQIW